MKKNEYIKNDIVKLRKTFELLSDLEYNIEFLKKYSEYLEIINRINSKEKIFKEYMSELKDEPFFYIEVFIIPTLKLISENKNILIKEYKKGSFEGEMNSIILNLLKLSQKLYCVGFEEQFLYTQNIFNNFLDKIKTTQKGNDLFVKTDLANIFHTIANKIKIKNEKSNINMNPLKIMSNYDVYKTTLTAIELSKNKNDFFSNSDNTKIESNLLGILDDWISKPIYTKKQLMGPIKLIQDKIDEIYGIDMTYIPYKKRENISPEISEEIILKNVGIIIKGRNVIKKPNHSKILFSKPEKCLIYFLYEKFKQNQSECFQIKDLAKIFEKERSKYTMRNMITSINSKIKKTIGIYKNIKVEKIIIRAKKESYQLNPKIII